MKWGRRATVLAGGAMLAFLAPWMTCYGEVTDNPYQGIVERNVFNLRPALPSTIDSPVAPPPKITLTGITDILGNKRVLFKVQVPPRPPLPPKEEFFILAEGQRDGDIEVLEINENSGVAKFNNHGVVQTLDIATDGAKPPASPMPIAQAPPPNRIPTLPPPAMPPGGGPQYNKAIPRPIRFPQLPDAGGGRVIPPYRGPVPPGTQPSAGP